jgi:hypothetical protein
MVTGKINIKNNSKINSDGQECPSHTEKPPLLAHRTREKWGTVNT